MEEAPPPRSVSELIEVWQDWTYQHIEKKRPRRWTLDNTSTTAAASTDGRKKCRYSDNNNRLSLLLQSNSLPMNFVSGHHSSSSDKKKKQRGGRKKRERHSYDGSGRIFHNSNYDRFYTRHRDDHDNDGIHSMNEGCNVHNVDDMSLSNEDAMMHSVECDNGRNSKEPGETAAAHSSKVSSDELLTSSSALLNEMDYSSMVKSNSVPPSPNDDGVFLFGLAEQLLQQHHHQHEIEETPDETMLDELDNIVDDNLVTTTDVSKDEQPQAEIAEQSFFSSNNSQTMADEEEVDQSFFTTHSDLIVNNESGAAADTAAAADNYDDGSLDLSEIVSDDDLSPPSSSLRINEHSVNCQVNEDSVDAVNREETVTSSEGLQQVVVDEILEPNVVMETVQGISQHLKVTTEDEAAAQLFNDSIAKDGTATSSDMLKDESTNSIIHSTSSQVEVSADDNTREEPVTSCCSEGIQIVEDALEPNLLKTSQDESENSTFTPIDDGGVAAQSIDDCIIRDETRTGCSEIINEESTTTNSMEHPINSEIDGSVSDNREEPGIHQ
eukprot:scaffold248346_cov46-Cyclotella_meneghiniana.AAC.3